MHWAVPYIGLPWEPTGEGPDLYHCWSFFRAIQARHFGLDVPEIPYEDDLLALARAFRDHVERARWDEVPVLAAREGDAVLMRRSKVPVHIGVWLEVDGGRVLHCAQGAGVVCQSPLDLRQNGWSIHGFYRFNGIKP